MEVPVNSALYGGGMAPHNGLGLARGTGGEQDVAGVGGRHGDDVEFFGRVSQQVVPSPIHSGPQRAVHARVDGMRSGVWPHLCTERNGEGRLSGRKEENKNKKMLLIFVLFLNFCDERK